MLKKIKEHKTLKYILNPYILTLLGFVIWMLFFDDNSFLFHRELDEMVDEKRFEINRYKKEIEKDKKVIKRLQDSAELENFAREEYYMKKDNEEIYIIEYQSEKNDDNE